MTLDDDADAAYQVLEAGQTEDAEQICNRLLAANPDAPRVLHVLARIRMQQGRSDESLSLLEKSLKGDPAQGDAWANLGTIRLAKGNLEGARQALQNAVLRSPEDTVAWGSLGMLLARLGQTKGAEQAFNYVLQLDASDARARIGLSRCYLADKRHHAAIDILSEIEDAGPAGWVAALTSVLILARSDRTEDAISRLERYAEACPDDHRPEHHLRALRGEIPDRAAEDYVCQLFESFAPSFDEALARLDYKAPSLVAEAAKKSLKGGEPKIVLDLGCGTGLSGAEIVSVGGQLVGVDLSNAMLQRAAQRGIYVKLIRAEITQFLNNMPAATADLAISADALNYFGNLAPVMRGLARALRPGGLVIATFEAADTTSITSEAISGWRIGAHGRFNHEAEYLRTVALEAGLTTLHLAEEILRRELGEPVKGYVIVLSRPAP